MLNNALDFATRSNPVAQRKPRLSARRQSPRQATRKSTHNLAQKTGIHLTIGSCLTPMFNV